MGYNYKGGLNIAIRGLKKERITTEKATTSSSDKKEYRRVILNRRAGLVISKRASTDAQTIEYIEVRTSGKPIEEVCGFLPDQWVTKDANTSKFVDVKAGKPIEEVCGFLPDQWVTRDANTGKFIDVKTGGKPIIEAGKDKLSLQ